MKMTTFTDELTASRPILTFDGERVTRPKPHSTPNVSPDERWISVMAGSLMVLYGLSKRSRAGAGLALLGSGLVTRGATGHCNLYDALGVSTARRRLGPRAVMTSGQGVRVEETITIDRPAAELYALWRDLKNLPRFMQHVESVEVVDSKRSHWSVKGPLDMSSKWFAEIINDESNSLIGWRSVEGSEVETAGSVHFKEAPKGRGTEVKVVLRYDPPAGKLGAAVARLFREEPGQQIRADLRRFKQLMETGTVPTTEGQPHGTCLSGRTANF
jgi:uncharacterized membrane protein